MRSDPGEYTHEIATDFGKPFEMIENSAEENVQPLSTRAFVDWDSPIGAVPLGVNRNRFLKIEGTANAVSNVSLTHSSSPFGNRLH